MGEIGELLAINCNIVQHIVFWDTYHSSKVFLLEQFYLQSFLSLVINRTASLPVCVGFAVWVFRDINDFCAEFDVERNSQQAVTNFYLTKNKMFAQAGTRLLLPASFG